MPDTASIRAFIDDRHLDLVSNVIPFVRKEIFPLPAVEEDEDARDQAKGILTLLGKTGWVDFAVGETPDLRSACLVREGLGGASSLADAVFALQCLGATPIRLAGSSEMKSTWLPKAVSGEAMMAFAMTEAEAGSDVGAMTTTAVREGSGYVINGAKTLISNAGIADAYVVFASTDPGQGKKGISAFLVEASNPGLKFLGPQVLSAPHPLGEISFLDCRVEESARLGEEGEGFKIGMATLDRLRTTVAAASCGMAERALEEAMSHAEKRNQFGQTLSRFQLIQDKIASMATELTASRLLVYRAAWEKDTGQPDSPISSSMAKAFATEAAQRIVDQSLQIHGGRGLLAENIVERLYRAVRALRIYEGTSEVLHLVIANQLFRARKGSEK
jgi:acyl-CoA dehydrogenase